MTRSRVAAAALLLLLSARGSAPSGATRPSPTPSIAPFPTPAPTLPPASLHPNYPPQNLADLVALAQRGTSLRFIGGEGQFLTSCSVAWDRFYEPSESAQQIAADLVKAAIDRQVLTRSCGGYVYGTTNAAFCNCYHGDHGLLTVNRGPDLEPAPGMMLVIFCRTEFDTSPDDWLLTVPAPTY